MKKNQWVWPTILLILLLFVANPTPGPLSIVSLSPAVQYYNEVVKVSFSSVVSVNVSTFFNDAPINYSLVQQNNVYGVSVNVSNEGLLRVVSLSQNVSDTLVIEVRKPFVDSTNNVPNVVDKGEIVTIQVLTLSPQGEPLEADSVDAVVTLPDNTHQTLVFEKGGNAFTTKFTYASSGNYVFKINARKVGYTTQEKTAITSVIKKEVVHPIFWVWGGALLLFIILFIVKQVRKR